MGERGVGVDTKALCSSIDVICDGFYQFSWIFFLCKLYYKCLNMNSAVFVKLFVLMFIVL